MYHLHVVLYYTKPYVILWYLYHYEHLYMYHLHVVLYYTKPYVMSWYMCHYEHLYMYHLHVVLYHMQCHGTCIIMNIYACTIYM